MIWSTFLFIVQFLFFSYLYKRKEWGRNRNLLKNCHLNMLLVVCCIVVGRQQCEKIETTKDSNQMLVLGNGVCSVNSLSLSYNIISVSYHFKSSSKMCRTSYYGKLLMFNRSYSHSEKIFLPTEKDLSDENNFLNPRSRRHFAPCHRWLFLATSDTSWLRPGCGGPCLFLLVPRRHSFPPQSACSSFPRGASGSTNISL